MDLPRRGYTILVEHHFLTPTPAGLNYCNKASFIVPQPRRGCIIVINPFLISLTSERLYYYEHLFKPLLTFRLDPINSSRSQSVIKLELAK